MENDLEMSAPSHLKMLEFNDILSFARKNNVLLTDKYFSRYGFILPEINWLKEHKGDVIKMNNEEILNQNNNIIKTLRKENIKLKEEIKKLKEKGNFIDKTETNLQIKKLGIDEWLVKEHRKMKHTGKKYNTTHIIPTKNVKNIYKIINMLTDEDNPSTGYRQVVSSIITKYKLNIDIESFNGGKHRSKYLFPLYYYPLKILEKKGYIKYNGGGRIKRLKFEGVEL